MYFCKFPCFITKLGFLDSHCQIRSKKINILHFFHGCVCEVFFLKEVVGKTDLKKALILRAEKCGLFFFLI